MRCEGRLTCGVKDGLTDPINELPDGPLDERLFPGECHHLAVLTAMRALKAQAVR